MSNVTIRDVYIAFLEYGSVQAAARSLKIKGAKVYYMQRKPEWKELVKEFEQGKIKIVKKNPKDLENAGAGSVAEKYFGKTISIEDAPTAKVPRLKVIKQDKTLQTKPIEKESIIETPGKEKEMTATAEKNFEAEVERYEKGMQDLMEQLKVAEKAKEKAELQRDATRNVNEQLGKRIEVATTEINKYKAEQRKEAMEPDLSEENKELNRRLETENFKLKEENEELKTDLTTTTDANTLANKRISKYKKLLDEEQERSKRLKQEFDKYMSLPKMNQDDKSAEFYKDTAHLYYERYKRAQLSEA